MKSSASCCVPVYVPVFAHTWVTGHIPACRLSRIEVPTNKWSYFSSASHYTYLSFTTTATKTYYDDYYYYNSTTTTTTTTSTTATTDQ